MFSILTANQSGLVFRVILLVSLFCLPSRITQAQTVGVGAGQTYSTLNDAFNAINTGTLTGAIRLEIRANITVTTTAVLNPSGTGGANYGSVSIYPTGNFSITANIDGPVIDLAGADRVTINGVINAVSNGTPHGLTLENSNAGSNACLVHIHGGGETNVVQYAILKGAGGSATRGMVTIDGTGNSINNIVQYSRITNSAGNRPHSVLYVNTVGSSSYSIFFGNEVYDVFHPGASTKSVFVTGTHLSPFIMNNHFYETTPLVATADATYRAISLEGAGVTGATVTGNYIGGSQSGAVGNKLTINSAFATQFDAIYVSGGSAAAPASVQENTITNISFRSAKTNLNNIYSPGFFNAVYVSGSNTFANIGSLTGNIIGSQAATDMIELYPTNSASYSPAVMIFNDATGTVNIQNNSMGGITLSGAMVAKSMAGILQASVSGNSLISGNTIGSSSTPNSIQVGSNSLNTTVNEWILGIACLSSSGNVAINNNLVSNITQEATGPNASSLKQLSGIFLLNGGTTVVNGNTIHSLTTYSNMLFGGVFSSLMGINVFQNSGTIGSVSGNSIYGLQNLNTGNLITEVTGIFFQGSTGNSVVRNNFIHDLQVSSSNTQAKITGLNVVASNGVSILSNNLVSLGTGVSAGYDIKGIYDGSQVATNANKFYYNTVYLGGTQSSGSNTAALYLSSAAPSGREIINNILVNERSSQAGSASHYGLYVSGLPVLTLNNNNYYTSGTGGVVGYYGGNQTILPIIAGQDGASLTDDPGFIAPGGSLPGDYMPKNALPASPITGYEDDLLGVTRPEDPFMGALHYIEVLPVTWLDFTLHPSQGQIGLKWSTASEQHSQDFVIQHSTNATDWKNIGIVPASGNSNLIRQYQFNHAMPSNGRNYYRLLQRDIDGKHSFSTTRRADINAVKGIQLLGNPVKAGMLSFTIRQSEELTLLSADGRLIWKKRFAAGVHRESVQLLRPGIYYLRSETETVPVVR